MQYLPVCLKLRDAPVVLVGGGTVATRKAKLLLRAGASLTVVSPDIEPELEALLLEHGGCWQQSSYTETDLHGRKLAEQGPFFLGDLLAGRLVFRQRQIGDGAFAAGNRHAK